MALPLAAIGNLAQIGSQMFQIIQSFKEQPQSKISRAKWKGMIPDSTKMLGGLFYNPSMGNQPKYKYTSGLPGGEMAYKFAPSTAMQNIYSSYLNRSYGLSNDMAQSMIASSASPLRMSEIKGSLSSAGAAKLGAGNPQAMATAMMGMQNPRVAEQLDYLQNAGNLASFNLWRSKQLGELIG